MRDPIARAVDAALIDSGFVPRIAGIARAPYAASAANATSSWQEAFRVAAEIHTACGGGPFATAETRLVVMRRGCRHSLWAAAFLYFDLANRAPHPPCPSLTASAMNACMEHRSLALASAVFNSYSARCRDEFRAVDAFTLPREPGPLTVPPELVQARMKHLVKMNAWNEALRLAAMHVSPTNTTSRAYVIEVLGRAAQPRTALSWFRAGPRDVRVLDSALGYLSGADWACTLQVLALDRASYASPTTAAIETRAASVSRALALLRLAGHSPSNVFVNSWVPALQAAARLQHSELPIVSASVLKVFDALDQRARTRHLFTTPIGSALVKAVAPAHRDLLHLPRYSYVTTPREASKLVDRVVAQPPSRCGTTVVLLDTNVVLRALLLPEFEEELHASITTSDSGDGGMARVFLPNPVVREVCFHVRRARGAVIRKMRRDTSILAAGDVDSVLAEDSATVDDLVVEEEEERAGPEGASDPVTVNSVEQEQRMTAAPSTRARVPIVAVRRQLWRRLETLIMRRKWTLLSPTHYGAIARAPTMPSPRKSGSAAVCGDEAPHRQPSSADHMDDQILRFAAVFQRIIDAELAKRPTQHEATAKLDAVRQSDNQKLQQDHSVQVLLASFDTELRNRARMAGIRTVDVSAIRY